MCIPHHCLNHFVAEPAYVVAAGATSKYVASPVQVRNLVLAAAVLGLYTSALV